MGRGRDGWCARRKGRRGGTVDSEPPVEYGVPGDVCTVLGKTVVRSPLPSALPRGGVKLPWLVRGDQVLASVELATGRRARARGLLGRDGIEGALLLEPARSVHTVGMRFPIDVAWLGADYDVIDIRRMVPGRISRPRLRARAVLEAQAGSFERWGLAVGDHLEMPGRHPDEP